MNEVSLCASEWIPELAVPMLPYTEPFLDHSTCAALDFLHPRYHEVCRMLHGPAVWHRKQWEWVFIVHHLHKLGFLSPGSKGIGFGVGQESLPALFASYGCEVLATDAPSDDGGWEETGQHSTSLDALRAPWIVADQEFDRLVRHRLVDMNAIPDDLHGFDFTWSSCCFEHLGSLDAGMRFVENSLAILRPGGIAVHTTEYNVGSNDETLTEGGTVIYRHRDMEELIERLRLKGNTVVPFKVARFAHHLDGHVDMPPYGKPHLKLQLDRFVATSVGIVAWRGSSS